MLLAGTIALAGWRRREKSEQLISSSSRGVTPLTQPGNKLLPLLGVFLVTGGFLLLGWLAYVSLSPGVAPYHYKLIEEGGAQ